MVIYTLYDSNRERQMVFCKFEDNRVAITDPNKTTQLDPVLKDNKN